MQRLDRRDTLSLALAAIVAACAAPRAAESRNRAVRLADGLAAIEARAGGRLGVCLMDTDSNAAGGWRMDERFAHCSSFKLSLAAMVLHGDEQGRWSGAENLRWQEADLVAHSPDTAPRTASGMSMRELARAALVTSDNTATNVLLRRLGGPGAMTEFWRVLGDRTSRLDRYEPELNRVPPGSLLDTTTPAAMARTVARLLLPGVLTPASRATLLAWMAEVESGKRRLRAGFPPDWPSGDKTGTAMNSQTTTYVDLAYVTPPNMPMLVIAAYHVPADASLTIDPAAEAVLAQTGELCARTWGKAA